MFVEKFIEGREFIVHVAQLFDEESGEPVYRVYEALERVFVDNEQSTRGKQFFHWGNKLDNFVEKHPELKTPSKISSSLLEDIYGNNAVDNFEFKFAPKESQAILKEVALNAFKAVGGQSYGRADIRAERPPNNRKFQLERCQLLCARNECASGCHPTHR